MFNSPCPPKSYKYERGKRGLVLPTSALAASCKNGAAGAGATESPFAEAVAASVAAAWAAGGGGAGGGRPSFFGSSKAAADPPMRVSRELGVSRELRGAAGSSKAAADPPMPLRRLRSEDAAKTALFGGISRSRSGDWTAPVAAAAAAAAAAIYTHTI